MLLFRRKDTELPAGGKLFQTVESAEVGACHHGKGDPVTKSTYMLTVIEWIVVLA